MTNNGAVSQTLTPGQSYTIPEGYHNGSGVVSATGYNLDTITREAFVTHTGGSATVNCNIGDKFLLATPSEADYSSYLTLNGASIISKAYFAESAIGGVFIAIVEASATSFTFAGTSGTIWGCFKVN